jgi:hypothetical protein
LKTRVKPIKAMKRLILPFLALVLTISGLRAQTETYFISSGELIFSWAEVSFTEEYQQANPDNEILNSPMRFSAFFHAGTNYHVDLGNTFGIYTGLGIRNVGFTTNERLIIESGELQDYKIVRRSYNVGIPFAIKLGSFDDHFYFYAGGEAELQFAYKEKYWDSHNRSGSKTNYHEWFGDQTNRFAGSAFVGIQLPKGFNVQFRYYLTDFLNHDYKNTNQVSDLRRYKTSNIMYFSASWQIDTDKIYKKKKAAPKG